MQESNDIAWALDATCSPMLSTVLKLDSASPGGLAQQLAFSALGSTNWPLV